MKASLASLLCFLVLSSTLSSFPVAAAVAAPTVQDVFAGSVDGQDNQTSISDQDIETLLDNNPELRELWDRQRYFFATVQWIERTLDEVENVLAGLEGHPINSDAVLENLVKTAELRAENLENKFLNLLWTLESMDGLPALFVNGEGARWVRIYGQLDNRLTMWVENVLLQTHKLIEKLRALQENSGKAAIDEVLIHVAAMRKLLDVPSSEHGGVEDLWFEHWDGGAWRRTTETNPQRSVRVMITLHNPRWLEREKLWIKMYWQGWYRGELYFDLPALYTGTHEIYSMTAPYVPGSYKFSIEGRWESWSCFFCWPFKTGEGTIPKWEITLDVRNRAPGSKYGPVRPLENSWGTTFTYWTEIYDPDGHLVEVTLYKDGVQHGNSKWVQGSGTPTWTWTSTSADIGDHDYYFVASDGYDTTRDPPEGTHSGPTVTKRGTSLSMNVTDTEPPLGQSVTFYGYLNDTTANVPLGGKTVTLKDGAGAGSSDTTNSQGYYSIMVTPSSGYYYTEFGGDSAYESSQSSTIGVTAKDKSAPYTPTMYSEPTYTQGTTNTVSWSEVEDRPPGLGSGTRDYYVQRATNSAFTAGAISYWTSETSYTFDLSDGTKYWYHVKARDYANNESGWSNVVFSTQDDTAPSAPSISSLTHPDSDVWYANPNPSFSWTTPQDLSGIWGYSYALDAAPDYTRDTTGNSKSYSNVSDGEHTFYVRARDGAGNWGPAASYPFRVVSAAAAQSYYSGFFLDGVSIPNSYIFIPPAGIEPHYVRFTIGVVSYIDTSSSGGWKSGTFDMGRVGLDPTLVVGAYRYGRLIARYHFYPEVYPTPNWLKLMLDKWWDGSVSTRDGYWVISFEGNLEEVTIPSVDIPVPFISGVFGLETPPLSFSFEISSDGAIQFAPGEPLYTKEWEFGIAHGKVEVTLSGRMSVADRTIRWESATLRVGGEVVGTYSMTYPIMVIGYLEWGIRVYATADLNFIFGPGVGGFQILPGIYLTDIQGEVTAGASVYGAAGIFFIARVEAGGGAELRITFEAYPTPRVKDIQGWAYLYAKVCILCDWVCICKTGRQEWRIFSPAELLELEENWKLVERRPLQQEFVWIQGAESGAFLRDVFSAARPSIAVDGDGNMMMVWIHDAGRPEREKTSEIYYSYYESSTRRWSEPSALTSNDLVDIAPRVIFDGSGRAIAVWHQIPHEFEIDENQASPFEVLREIDLVYSVWDPATKTWSAPQPITANEGLDTGPALARSGDQVMLAYVSYPDGNLFAFENNSLWYARWTGEGWSQPELVAQNVGIVSEPALALSDEGEAMLAFVRDMDGLMTLDDREIWRASYEGGAWGELERLTDDTKSDSWPSVVRADGKWYLTWMKENARDELDVIYMAEVSNGVISPPSVVLEVENMMLFYQKLLGASRGNFQGKVGHLRTISTFVFSVISTTPVGEVELTLIYGFSPESRVSGW